MRIRIMVLCALLAAGVRLMMRRYSIDWYAEGRWFSIGRTWRTKWGALRACRRVLRDARCGAAREVIVLSPVERTAAGRSPRPAPWNGASAPVGAGR